MADLKNVPESTKVDRRKVDLVRMWKRLHPEPAGADDDPPTIRFIGVYRVEKRLGHGGMGKVYLAHDDRLGRPVAIKQIRGDKGRQSVHHARLRREARAVARLNHPAIAQVHDVVYDTDGYSVVMEYVEGRTVAQLLASGELHGGLAVNAAIQVAQGLAAAHSLDMVHRDLKAENVMVTPGGFAKILDFGLVKKLSPEETRESLTERGFLLGTVVSMSPEQASGRPVDARSDLFSLGVLLYEMFTGYSPFRRERWLESLESIRNEQQVPARTVRPELPEELSDLIDWLLRKDPAKRPRNTQIVVDLLARIAATTGVGNLPPPRGSESPGSELSDAGMASTGTFPRTGEVDADPGAAGGSSRRRRGGRVNASTAGMAILVLATVGLLIWRVLSPVDSLRLLVLEPELQAPAGRSDGFQEVASGVLASTLEALESLDRLAPIEPPRRRGGRSAAEEARRAGASEVLVSEIACQNRACMVLFQRIRAEDAGIVDTSGHFRIPVGRSEQVEMDLAVAEQIRKLFPGHLPDSRP